MNKEVSDTPSLIDSNPSSKGQVEVPELDGRPLQWCQEHSQWRPDSEDVHGEAIHRHSVLPGAEGGDW